MLVISVGFRLKLAGRPLRRTGITEAPPRLPGLVLREPPLLGVQPDAGPDGADHVLSLAPCDTDAFLQKPGHGHETGAAVTLSAMNESGDIRQ